jgi:fluoroquinolone transport system permease protein
MILHLGRTAALAANDLRLVGRDALLRWLLVLPLASALGLRALLAPATRWLAPWVHLQDYYLLGVSLFVLNVPVLFGLAIGFLLLDERDDGMLAALRVTPMSLRFYAAYRVAVPALLAMMVMVAIVFVVGVVSFPPGALVAAGALAALEAPLIALFLVAFAQNKVQGLALAKILGALMVGPVAAWFMPGKWQLLAGIVPPFWPVKAMWSAARGEGDWWLYVIGGAVFHALLLWLLLRRFERTVERA